MHNIPQDTFREISEKMCRPEGSFRFDYTCKELFDKTTEVVIVEIPSKGHYFRLDRNKEFRLNFYHSSPGTGTRIASIDLAYVPPADTVFICCTWSPVDINLYIGPRITNGQLFQAKGVPSSTQFVMGKNGLIFQLGDLGVEVMGATAYNNGEKILKPTVIQTWQETITAISILDTGHSDKGYIYEVVVANLTLSMLVTGFETYSKTRFLELEEEGILPDTNSLLNAFLSKREREKDLAEIMILEAKQNNKTLLQYIVEKNKVNFQNFDNCKTAYNKAYKIQFGNIGDNGQIIENIHKYILYRHKVIHINPLIAIYNEEDVPKADPIFAKRQFAITQPLFCKFETEVSIVL